MSIGSRLKEARMNLNFSQEEVAKRINVHRTTIGKYENGESQPSLDILLKLIEIYCEDANYILFGKTKRIINIELLPDSVVDRIILFIGKYYHNEKIKNEDKK